MITNFLLYRQKDHKFSPLVYQFASQNSDQFLFYSHAQVLMSAVQNPKQKWYVESFSIRARLVEWPIIDCLQVLEELMGNINPMNRMWSK